jgi:hypothetical protein
MSNGLGRMVPKDFEHIDKFPLRALGRGTTKDVEKLLVLPKWHTLHDQGEEGACVGFGTSMMLSMLNEHQCRTQGQKEPYIRYNPWWLWDRAKEIDEFQETNPGDSNGTTVRAACEILRTIGHVLWEKEEDNKSFLPPETTFGISAYRWATNVDEMRTAIDSNQPLVIGVNWYLNFDSPVYKDGEWWIGLDANNLGRTRGGHSLCLYGASDKRQAFRGKNSWGPKYPEFWIPFTTTERLIREQGEVAIITDL